MPCSLKTSFWAQNPRYKHPLRIQQTPERWMAVFYNSSLANRGMLTTSISKAPFTTATKMNRIVPNAMDVSLVVSHVQSFKCNIQNL